METKNTDSNLPDSLLEQPGKRSITWKEYQTLLYAAFGTPEYDRLQGPTLENAAAGLGLSRQALERAIDQGTLDAWYIYDGYVPGVRRLKVINVTTESIARFKSRTHRRN